MTAQEKLFNKTKNAFHICVGLDSDIKKIPNHLRKEKNAILQFNKAIIDATADEAAAYKLNFAFYENWGIEGLKTLDETISYIPSDILVIGDAKRGDIGNTSQKYAESIFDHFKCDSITLHPYMGSDSVQPFLDYEDKISFLLCLTSNPSSRDFEKQKLENGNYLYQEVITKVNSWNEKNNCGLVFGATNPNELKENISDFNDLPILLPGVGAQGGSLEDIAKIFLSNNKSNYLVNISRGLIYSDDSMSFESVIRERIKGFNQSVKQILER